MAKAKRRTSDRRAARELGHRVKRIIDEIHRTRPEVSSGIAMVAEDLAVPRTTVYHLVNGDHSARVELVQAFADRYTASLEWLLTGNGPGPDYSYTRDARAAVRELEERYRALEQRIQELWEAKARHDAGQPVTWPTGPWPIKAMVPEPPPLLNAGYLTWRFVLRKLKLSDAALAAWSRVPLAAMLKATRQLGIDAPTPDAVSEVCRAWHRWIMAARRHLGDEHLRDRLEKAAPAAAQDFPDTTVVGEFESEV